MNDIKKYESFANDLLIKHNLSDWKFVLNTRLSNSILGKCKYIPKEIHLNKRYALIADEELVIDTIIHEVAHALTKGHRHNHVWKAKCIELGCKPNRTKKLDRNINIRLTKYKGVCPTCGHEIFASRKISYVHTRCSNEEYQRTGNSNYKKHIYLWKDNEQFIK
jgi:predicted SprT family Zn-dependent metalloprotease